MYRISTAFILAFSAAALAAPPIALDSRLEPFLDTYLIASQANTALRLQAPRPAETVIQFNDKCSRMAIATACTTGAIPWTAKMAPTGR